MTNAEAIKELIGQVAELRKELLELTTSRRSRMSAADTDHREHPDPTPMEVPIGFEAPPTLKEMVNEAVAVRMDAYAESMDLGTFEQEDDHEPENEDLLLLSGFEVTEYEMEDEAPVEDASQALSSHEDPPKAESHEVTQNTEPREVPRTEPAPPEHPR